MYAFLGLGGMVGFLASLIILIIKAIKKKPKVVPIITLSVSFVLFVIALIITPKTKSEKTALTDSRTSVPTETIDASDSSVSETTLPTATSLPSKTIAPTAGISEREALQQELKSKYDIGKPQMFARGDATGVWRIVKVANGTPPSDYAVEYARAYMEEGDIHFVVNFSLKTTTMFKVVLGVVEARTTEYVSQEEHDATIIGRGMLYSDQYFRIETGEEIIVDGNPNAGIVDANELITTVKQVIDGTVGDGEKIVDVTFDGTNLIVIIDLSNANTTIFTARDIALSRISSITDKILELDDEYYNTWDIITLDFGKEGKAVLDKSLVKDQGFGRFFDFSDDVLK